jgi:hypothetical protein
MLTWSSPPEGSDHEGHEEHEEQQEISLVGTARAIKHRNRELCSNQRKKAEFLVFFVFFVSFVVASSTESTTIRVD